MTSDSLAAALTTRWLGRELIVLPESPSTSDECMQRGRAGAPHGLVVLADTQTRGRGRQGHTWFSPRAENLYLSALLRVDRAPADVPPITLAAGIAVCDTVNSFIAGASLKWPNDVLVAHRPHARKIAGILTEMSTRGGRAGEIVVGIGVNVNTTAFPPELADRATSLARESGAPLDRTLVAARLLAALERAFDTFLAPDGLAATCAAWRERASFFGQRVRVSSDDGVIEGLATGLDDRGALLLQAAHGPVRIIAGEVALIEDQS